MAFTVRNARRLALGGAAILVVFLAYLGRGLVADYIAPLVLLALWSVIDALRSISQFTLWGLLLGLLTLVAARSLTGHARSDHSGAPAAERRQAGRVQALAGMLAAMGESAYFSHRVMRLLALLTLDVLGDRQGLSPRETWAKIEAGDIALEPLIRDYVAIGWGRIDRPVDPMRGRVWDLLERVARLRRKEPWPDDRVDQMIAFLERELEVKHGDD